MQRKHFTTAYLAGRAMSGKGLPQQRVHVVYSSENGEPLGPAVCAVTHGRRSAGWYHTGDAPNCNSCCQKSGAAIVLTAFLPARIDI